MLAAVYLALLWLVLSEIEPFRWEHLRTNAHLKVLVGDEPVFVEVKTIKDDLEVPLGDVNAPKVEVELELSL